MSDGASAISDALERSMCLAPAGEKVAALTLGDALSEHGGPIPNYREVSEIGHFSVKDEEYVDSAVQRRYLRKPFPQSCEWDLNKGYESALRRNFPSRSSHLLNWVRLHKDKVLSAPSPDEERPSTALEDRSSRTVFLSSRFTLKTLMCTPFARKQAWLLGACRYRDFIYIYNLTAELKGADSPDDRHAKRRDRMSYWGAKFHRIMTSKEPGAAADDDQQLRETESYSVVLRSKLGSQSIVFSAEVKAVDASVECDPGSTAGYVEFKLTRFQEDSMDAWSDTFKRHALPAWWAQCHLASVPRALCGFRNDRGKLVGIEDIDVKSMPEMAGTMWSEGVCMRFCDRLLSFIKEHTEVDDGRTVYLFEYIPRSGEIVCKRLTDPDEAYRPREDLPRLFEGVGSVQNS
ncbi:hypothetical protein MRX96_008643 [Rhipicephalus microplus]|uniref:decapping and exoribonuclease protein isoform X1 n=1 Tax=Rhipicephalus microplus TaxID=6941 RepID=UPI003F6BEFB2